MSIILFNEIVSPRGFRLSAISLVPTNISAPDAEADDKSEWLTSISSTPPIP